MNLKNKSEKVNIIGLHYLSGVLTEIELEEIKIRLAEVDITLVLNDRSGLFYNSIEELTNVFSVVLSGITLTNLISGIIPNVAWDCVKGSITQIYKKVNGKKYNKINSSGIEERTISIGVEAKLETKEFNFRFDNISSEQTFLSALDRILVFLNEQKEEKLENILVTKEYVVTYSEDKEIWIEKNFDVIIDEKIEKQKMRDSDS